MSSTTTYILRTTVTAFFGTMMRLMSIPSTRHGLQARHLQAVDALHAKVRGPFGIDEAMEVLHLDRPAARRQLAWLATRGWLARVQPGLYVLVPLGSARPASHPAQPWLLAKHLFAPCYLGGFTALEHWGLTEQVFRSVCVMTRRRRGRRELVVQGTRFLLRVRPEAGTYGTRRAWIDGEAVDVSDPALTVVDALADPDCAGGLLHASLALQNWWESEHRNVDALLAHAARSGNRSVYKRLGYLAEHFGWNDERLLAACRERKSAGVALLDPGGSRTGPILSRWSLRINRTLDPQVRS